MGRNITEYYKTLTPEQRYEQSMKGKIASDAAKARKKSQREILKQLLALDVDDPKVAAYLKELGLPPSYSFAMALATIKKAVGDGVADIEAARYVRDTIGEKPTDTYNLGIQNKPIQALDMSKLSDAELEALADGLDDEAAVSAESE